MFYVCKLTAIDKSAKPRLFMIEYCDGRAAKLKFHGGWVTRDELQSVQLASREHTNDTGKTFEV